MRVSLKPAKRPFNIHAMLRRTRQEVKQFADAAMFDLAEQGYATLEMPSGLTCDYFSFDLRPAICASVSPVKRKVVQSSIAFAPICL